MAVSTKFNPGLLKLMLIMLFAGISSCSSDSEPVVLTSPDDLVRLEQGWTKQTAIQAHHTSFGSRLMPLKWLLHLKKTDGINFLAPQSVTAMGFLVEQKSAHNPDGLPVGFTIDQRPEVPWVGIGCTACHTGEVEYAGQRIRLEGGQGLVNFSLFEATLTEALQSTLEDENKWSAFAALVNPEKPESLKSSVKARLDYLRQRQKINRVQVPYGYGRLDAFGQIFNRVGVELLNLPENRLSPDAPVSFPVLWDAPHLDLVQWNGSAPNTDPGPLLQNITTAIAVYGDMDVVHSDAHLGFKSSVDIDHLKALQNWVYQLKSPQWPEAILGRLNLEKVAAGKIVYEKACLACHQVVNRDHVDRKLKAILTPVDEVGTDPKMVDNFLNAQAKSGVLEGKKLLWLAGKRIQATEKSIDLVAHVAVGGALNHPLQTIEATITDYHSVYKAAVNNNPDYYKARPLSGIWSSAPYLHNGSVLTLQELLNAPEQRRSSFYLGDRRFDPQRVGLISSEGENRSLFDTSLPGNSHQGHLYGTDLVESEKAALLEYLKSL